MSNYELLNGIRVLEHIPIVVTEWLVFFYLIIKAAYKIGELCNGKSDFDTNTDCSCNYPVQPVQNSEFAGRMGRNEGQEE